MDFFNVCPGFRLAAYIRATTSELIRRPSSPLTDQQSAAEHAAQMRKMRDAGLGAGDTEINFQ